MKESFSAAGPLGGGYQKGLKDYYRGQYETDRNARLKMEIQDAIMRREDRNAGMQTAGGMFGGGLSAGVQSAGMQQQREFGMLQNRLGAEQAGAGAIQSGIGQIGDMAAMIAGMKYFKSLYPNAYGGGATTAGAIQPPGSYDVRQMWGPLYK